MKIAVPLFGTRVSPHFGASGQILSAVTQAGRIVKKEVIDAGTNDPAQLARRLSSSGVDRLVCGGIQRLHKQIMLENGIQVVDNQKGNAEELILKMAVSENPPSDPTDRSR
ncbi:MAG: NifB/NifX family molybdenum-iron cluster-binding protein [Desulfotignum sp.]|nr:NifB/NifX family molybdenum-iron cluster-binding protein [Desulfotignum sp.]